MCLDFSLSDILELHGKGEGRRAGVWRGVVGGRGRESVWRSGKKRSENKVSEY